jgi:FKBP-type peptidyl-prolyl cis-trans isomerase
MFETAEMIYRNKFFLILIVAGGSLFFQGCEEDAVVDKKANEERYFKLYMNSNYPGVDPRPSGLYYIEHKAGTGAVPGEEDWLIINHAASEIPGEKVFESYLEQVAWSNGIIDTSALYGPYKVQNGTFVDGVSEGLSLMAEGGQSIMCFTSELGYGIDGFSLRSIKAYQSLKYEIELVEVIPDIVAYEQNRLTAFVDTLTGAQSILDPDTDATMHYIIDEVTEGSTIDLDSVVGVAYKGYLIDGRVFDERGTNNPIEVTMGEGAVIRGWELGLLRFREGEKGRLVIPYPLGYGEEGDKTPNGKYQAIPPYETLIFDVEIVSVESSSDSDSGAGSSK